MNLTDNVHGIEDLSTRLFKLFSEHEFNGDGLEGARTFGQQMIVANWDTVWALDVSLAYMALPDGELWADGSGRGFALGAGIAPGQPDQRIVYALNAAAKYDDHTAKPFYIERIEMPKGKGYGKTPKKGMSEYYARRDANRGKKKKGDAGQASKK